MLLYPISVLSGSVLAYRPRAAWSSRGLAAVCSTPALLWRSALGVIPAAAASADVANLPAKQVVYSVFVTTRGLRDGGADRLLPVGEPAHGGRHSSRRRRKRRPTCAS